MRSVNSLVPVIPRLSLRDNRKTRELNERITHTELYSLSYTYDTLPPSSKQSDNINEL